MEDCYELAIRVLELAAMEEFTKEELQDKEYMLSKLEIWEELGLI